MDEFLKTKDKKEFEDDFSFRNYFVPLTTAKVITWLIIIGFIVYANMLFNPFVWDDMDYIVNNSLLHSINLAVFFGNNIFNNAGQYRPLTVAYFAFIYALFGYNQFFYHILQLALHVVDTILLFILFKTFFNKKVSFFLSLLFLIHPIQIESVSYISSSDSPLFFLFGISGLLLGIGSESSVPKKIIQYLLLFASILVKETGILFLPLIILYKIIFKKKHVISEIIFSSITAVLYFFIRYFIGNVSLASRPMIPIARLDLLDRLLTLPKILFYYLKTWFFPLILGINQQWVVTKITFANFYFPLLIDVFMLSLLLFFGYRLYRKKSKLFGYYLFFFAWLVLGLGIHSQIIALDITVADKWAYFTMAGLLGLVGIVFEDIAPSVTLKEHGKTILLSAAIFIIVVLSVRTFIRDLDWQNPVYLWQQAITVNDNYLSEEELSIALLEEGKLNEAVLPAKKSVAYFPNDNNLYNLGYLYEGLGKTEKAQQVYDRAIHAKNYIPWQHKHYLQVYARLALLLIYHKNFQAAKKVLIAGIKDYPQNTTLLLYLATSEYELGEQKQASAAAKKALSLAPGDATIENLDQRILNHLAVVPVYTNPFTIQ